MILPDQAYDYINPEQALAALESVDAASFYFGTLAQRCPRSRDTLHALLDASNAKRFLDLNLRDGQYDERCVFHSLHAADVAKVNEEELQVLFGWYFGIDPSSPPLSGDEVRAGLRGAGANVLAGGTDRHAGPPRLGVLRGRGRTAGPPRQSGAAVRDRHGGRRAMRSRRFICWDVRAAGRWR
ncbi:hypothetical protein LP420_23480 [Massilia sp. B-10]|nr:hypothetical protein LP420_23480 [Massilia sp. B-10]